MMAASEDNRGIREPRVTVNKEFASLEEFIKEYVMNLSRSGAFIRSDNPPPVGTEVTVRLSVILDDIETIEGVGEVVRISDDPPGMGIRFKQLTQISRTLIETLLARRLARKGRP